MSNWRDRKRVSTELTRERIALLDSKPGITFDMPKGTAKAWNGKQFQDVTDADLDALGIPRE